LHVVFFCEPVAAQAACARPGREWLAGAKKKRSINTY